MSEHQQSYKDILKAVAFKAKVPTMMVGAPATTKSATVRALGEELGYGVITLLGSQMDPTDFAGMPQGRELGKTSSGEPIHGTVYLAPVWQIRLLKQKKMILFLDEYSNTPPAVRAGFLTLIQDRIFPSGHKVPDETIIIGAMNPPDEAADGSQMDLPTKNRFFHIAWDPPAEEWYEGMLVNWNRPAPESEMEWKAKIVGYVRDNPSMLHKQPSEDAAATGNVFARTASEKEVLASAWPSRRSWDNLSKALADAPDNEYVRNLIAQGLVGYEAAGGFLDWIRKNDVVDPRKVLENPDSVNWGSLSINDSNLLFRSIIELADDENALKAIAVFEKVAESGKANIAGPFVPRLMRKISSKDAEAKSRMLHLAKSYSNVAKNA